MVATKAKKSEASSNGAGARLPDDVVADIESIGELVPIRIRFTGITPLIQNSTRGMNLKKAKANKEPSVKAAGIKTEKGKTPEEEAEIATYPVGDGTYYHPASAFRSAMIDACEEKGIGFAVKGASGRDKTVYVHDYLRGSFFNVDEQAVLLDPKTGKPLTKYSHDFRIARNKNAGNAAVECHRPRWDEWMCEVEFEYDPSILHVKLILMAANLAGARAGIGCLRPLPPAGKFGKREGKGGRFGRWKAEIVE